MRPNNIESVSGPTVPEVGVGKHEADVSPIFARDALTLEVLLAGRLGEVT